MLDADDTIVAISTAAGASARAIVRLSGPEALRAAAAVFGPSDSGAALADSPGFRWLDGLVRIALAGRADIELPARAYVFRAPRSYTRQDVVELHVPGSPAAASALTARLIAAGARQAEPGEFTARAFFSGRLDLSAAQAVADVIHAAAEAQLRSSVAAVGGAVHRLCDSAAAGIADALAGVEAAIDLAEEHVSPDCPAELAERLAVLAAELRAAARRAVSIPDTAQRPHAVLAGRPNVGKSSLLNALTDTDRAIVSALAGTTRDVLSATMALGDCAGLVLQDAAGFARDASEAAPADSLAAAADSAARRAVGRADALLLVVDATAGDLPADLALLQEVRAANADAPLLVLANKSDLLADGAVADRAGRIEASMRAKTVATSAVTRRGLGRVVEELRDMLNLHATRSGEALGLHERQKRCLLAAAEAADLAAGILRPAAEVADVAELAAVELRAALAELGQISGQVVTEDILGRIFARFCVGK